MKAAKWKRRIWTQEEDKQLKFLVEEQKITNWVTISNYFNKRSNKDCRDHYLFQLSPNVVRRKWTIEEEAILLEKFKEFGPKWVKLTSFFDKRSPDDLRNRIKLIQKRKKPLRMDLANNTNSTTNATIPQNISTNIKTDTSHSAISLPKNTQNDMQCNNISKEKKKENLQSLFDFDENDYEDLFSANSLETNFFIE